MGLMKRYLVVVVGVLGSPAEAQRSEVGAYRTEAAAQQAGTDEWRRILFVHAPHVDRYRVVIERDGAEVGEIAMPEIPADAAPGILDETVTPLGIPLGAAGESLEPKAAVEPDALVTDEPEVLDSTGEMAVVLEDAEPTDNQATGEVPIVPRDADEPVAGDADPMPPMPSYVIEDAPDGPVPDDIIARFAEAVRGEEERAAERSDRDRNK